MSTILISKLAQGRLPCRLITLTREPISRAISFAFEDWHTKAPDARLANGSLDADALTSAVDRMLRSGGSHADPGQWFDNELKRTFGLDVFSIPYDERRGYSIMRHPGVELLILRMEDMNRSLPAALAEFLGIAADRIVISPANESDGKWYSEAANTVKQTFRVPEELLNTLLSSRFIRHFYPNDVDRLRKRWGQ